uniref:SAP domain-containing protein n=1 Tax=Monopterus albus TaxID=43700 RepID=A0A3Q3QJ29_MONAL
ISTCPSSSPIEHHGIHQLPVFNSLPETTVWLQFQGMCVSLQTARPPSPTCSSSLSPPLNFNNLPHSRKPRDTKPKMRKLKYHQYIPPDQRGLSGTGDPAYSHLLNQQQVFLQLEILQNQQQQQQLQQQLTVVSRYANSLPDPVKSTGAVPMNPQPLPATANHTSMHTSPGSKPELLPANLVDLTVSELRQQLRKRGLPVSGTKPALLQRLRPFQLPHACLTPTPLSQLGTSMELLTSCPPLPASQSPSSSSSSGPDSPRTPSPTLPLSSSSPLQSGTLWTIKKEQQELSVELEMRERIRSRPRDRSDNTGTEVRTDRLGFTKINVFQSTITNTFSPFFSLVEDPFILSCNRVQDTLKGTKLPLLSNQVFSCQQCDVIGQDYELPVQITASPVQTVHSVRSLEEELQEAIQKAQMDPRQSIDDILDEPITCVGEYLELIDLNGSVTVSDHKSIAHSAPSRAPSPQAIQSQSSQQYNRDDNFLPSPLCSSLLLELPPSPAVINPSQVVPAPPPPLICISPLPSTGKSRKRRAPTPFDAADWLETLDSDLNINRVLDLMVEQW